MTTTDTPQWASIAVGELHRGHLGLHVDTGAAAGTLTVLHDAHHGGSPCRTLVVDTADGEIATVTYSGRGPYAGHLPWTSPVLVAQVHDGSGAPCYGAVEDHLARDNRTVGWSGGGSGQLRRDSRRLRAEEAS